MLQTHIFPVSYQIATAFDNCNEAFDNTYAACSKWAYCGSQKPFQEASISDLREAGEHNL